VGCGPADAARHVERADGDVKSAVMLGFGLEPAEAEAVLARHGGNLRHAVDEVRLR
jgi:N-acetylmuramic acid 6-phosphate etherase